ncbi:MAG: hypothetical protein ACTHMM_20050 [Agriterribacter sp.]
MRTIRFFSVLNLVALVVHIFFSYGTQLKLFNAKDVGEISDQYNSLFTPAGVTFAIWGLIYFMLLLFCIYRIASAWKKDITHIANRDTLGTGAWFTANNLAAAAWLIAWTNDKTGLSVYLIFFQLICLVVIHVRLGLYNPSRSAVSSIFTQIPLSIYFGWITIACIANTAVYLKSIGWDGWGYPDSVWTVVMIGLAVLLTVIIVLSRRNVSFGLVVIWALYGIISKRQAIDAAIYEEIIKAAWIGIALVGAVCIVRLAMNFGRHEAPKTFPLAPHSLK